MAYLALQFKHVHPLASSWSRPWYHCSDTCFENEEICEIVRRATYVLRYDFDFTLNLQNKQLLEVVVLKNDL